MSFDLNGNAPSCLSAGILLLSKARSFGQPISVRINPFKPVSVKGPALICNPLLLGLGIPGAHCDQNSVILPGASTRSLLIQLSENQWTEVDRTGNGGQNAAKALVSLIRSHQRPLQELGVQAISFLHRLGILLEPAALDILFDTQLSSVVRTQLFLHIGRHMSRQTGRSLSSYFLRKPIDVNEGPFQMIRPEARLPLLNWLSQVSEISNEHAEMAAGIRQLVDDISLQSIHRLSLPFTKSELGIVRCFSQALSSISTEDDDAIDLMTRRFKFLGGNMDSTLSSTVTLSTTEMPNDRIERWNWLLSEIQYGAMKAEEIWRQYMDPHQ